MVRPVTAGTVIRASCPQQSFVPHFSALSNSVPHPALAVSLFGSPQELPAGDDKEERPKGRLGIWRIEGRGRFCG